MEKEQEKIGPYMLTRFLGEGGMGALYVGHLEEDDLKTEVAIKVVNETFSRSNTYVNAFQREAEIAAQIEHPNVVRVLDRGEDRGAQFLVMELLRGRSLAEIFQKAHAEDVWVPRDLAIWIIARVAEGLQHVHDATDEDGNPLHMVHGDISPQNIFITEHGEVKLIDFGLAHSATRPDDAKSSASSQYGKVHYVSPEQASAKPLDLRSDIFSLGATLFESLAGHSPFSAASKYLVLLRISQGEPDSIRDHVEDIEPELETILNRCLARDPGERLQSAEALRSLADSYLEAGNVYDCEPHLATLLRDLFGTLVVAAELSPRERRITASLATREEVEDHSARPKPWIYLLAGLGIGILAGLILLVLSSRP